MITISREGIVSLSRAGLDEVIGSWAIVLGTIILVLLIIFIASKIWKFKFNIRFISGAIIGGIIGYISLELLYSAIMSLIIKTQILILIGTITSAIFSQVGLISLDEGFLFGVTGAISGWILLTTVLGAIIVPKLKMFGGKN